MVNMHLFIEMYYKKCDVVRTYARGYEFCVCNAVAMLLYIIIYSLQPHTVLQVYYKF